MDPGSGQDDVVRLLVTCQPRLSAYIYAQCEAWDLVEEVVQETAVYILAHWQDYQAGTSFDAWVRTVASLRLKELYRQKARSRRAQVLDGIAEAIPDPVWSQEGVFGPRHRAALSSCLGTLPAKLRHLVALRFEQGRDGAALARQFNTSVDAIHMSLIRLRRRLKDCVERRLAGGDA